nr:MAG TPA: RNA dependent RNA polymerase [Caudoviricetes sp.]
MAKNNDFSQDGEDLENMEEFNFDDLDSGGEQFDPDATVGSGRDPAASTVRRTYSAARDEILNKSARDHARGIINRSLSTDANSAFDNIESAFTSGIEETQKALKPLTGGLASLSKNLQKLAPAGGKIDTILGKVTAMLSNQENAPAHEQVAAETAEMVADQIAGQFQNMESQYQQFIKTAEEINQSSLVSVMQQNVAVNSIIKEQNKIYYNKSLAFQWRIATGVEEGLKLSRIQFETTMKQLENIVHNTSLPEAVKITNMELAGQRLKQIAFDTMSESLYKKIAPLEKIKGSLLRKLREKVSDAVDTIDMVSGGVEMSSELYSSLKEAGMGPQELVGSQLGGLALNKIYGLLGKSLPEKFRRSLEHSFISGASNPVQYLRSIRSQNPTGLFGKLKNKGIDWFTDLVDEGESKNRINLSFKGLNQPAVFDGRTHRTVNIVIPELLSKIHNETRAIARKTGAVADEKDELKYDATGNKFVTKGALQSHLGRTVASLQTNANKVAFAMAKEIGNTLANVETKNKDVIITTQLPKAIKNYTARYGNISPEAMVHDRRFMELIKPEYQLETMTLLEEYLTDLKRGNKTSSAYNMFANAANMITMPPSLIEKYVNGMGGDLLSPFVRRDELTGAEEIDTDFIRKLYTGEVESVLGRRSSGKKYKRYKVDNKMYRSYDTSDINFTDDLLQSGKNYHAWATSRGNNETDYWKEGGSYTSRLGIDITRGAALSEEERDELNNAKRLADELDAYIKSPEVARLLNSRDKKEREEGEALVRKKEKELNAIYNKKSVIGRVMDWTRKADGKSIFDLRDAYNEYKKQGRGSYTDFVSNRFKQSLGYQSLENKLTGLKQSKMGQAVEKYSKEVAEYAKDQAKSKMALIQSTELYKQAESRFKNVVDKVTQDPRIQALDSYTRAKYVMVADHVTKNMDKVKQTRAIQTLLEMSPEEIEKEFKNALKVSKDKIDVYKGLVDNVVGQQEGAMDALTQQFSKDFQQAKSATLAGYDIVKDKAGVYAEQGTILGKEKFEMIRTKADEIEEKYGILGKGLNFITGAREKAEAVYQDLKSGVTKDNTNLAVLEAISKNRDADTNKNLQQLKTEIIRREYKPLYDIADEEGKKQLLQAIKEQHNIDIDLSKRGVSDKKFDRLLTIERATVEREKQKALSIQSDMEEISNKEEKVKMLESVVADIAAGVDPVEAVKKRQGFFSKMKGLFGKGKRSAVNKFDSVIGYEKSDEEKELEAKERTLIEVLENIQGTAKEKKEQQLVILKELVESNKEEAQKLRQSTAEQGVDVDEVNSQASKANNKGKDYSKYGPNHWRNKKRLKYIGQFDFVHRLLNDTSIRNPIGLAMFLAGQTIKAHALGAGYGAKYAFYKFPKAIWTSKTATRLRQWEREKYKQSLLSIKQGFKNLISNKFYIPDMLMFAGKALSNSTKAVRGLWSSKTAMALREAEKGFITAQRESEKDTDGKSWLGTLMSFLRLERLAGEAHAEGLAELNTQQQTASSEKTTSLLGGFFSYLTKRNSKKDKVEEEALKEETNTKSWRDKIKESWENTKEKWKERGRKVKGYFTGPTGPNGEKEGMFDKVTRIGGDLLKAGVAGGLLYVLMNKERRESLIEGVKGFAHGLSVVWQVMQGIGKGIGYVVDKLVGAWNWLKSKMPSFLLPDDSSSEPGAPKTRPDGTLAYPSDPDYNSIQTDHSQARNTGEMLAYGGLAALAARPVAKLYKIGKAIAKPIGKALGWAKDKLVAGGTMLWNKFKAGHNWGSASSALKPTGPSTVTSAATDKVKADKVKMQEVKKAAKTPGAKVDVKDIPTSEKKGIAKKVVGVLESFKEKALKKLGPKAGVKLTAIIGSKIAARLVPIVGWGLLVWDAGWIIKYMLDGYSLASAVSLQILGFDLLDPSSEALDEDGNPIRPDENVSVNATKEQMEEISKAAPTTTKEEMLRERDLKNDILKIEDPNELKKKMEAFQETIKNRDDRKEKLKQLNIEFAKAFQKLTNDERSVELVTKNKGQYVKYGTYKDGVYFLGEPISAIVWDPTKSYIWIGNYIPDNDPKKPPTIDHIEMEQYIKRMKALAEEGLDVGLPKSNFSFEELYKELILYKINAIKAKVIAVARAKGRDTKLYEDTMNRAVEEPGKTQEQLEQAKGSGNPYTGNGSNVVSPGVQNLDAAIAAHKDIVAKTPNTNAGNAMIQQQKALMKDAAVLGTLPPLGTVPPPGGAANNPAYGPSVAGGNKAEVKPNPKDIKAASQAAPAVKPAPTTKPPTKLPTTSAKGLDPKITKMVNRVVASATTTSRKSCAKYVRLAIEGAGFRNKDGKRIEQSYLYSEKDPFNPKSRTYAINFHDNGILAANGFTQIATNSPYQVGDIMVLRNGKHPGHIQIYAGPEVGWVSDFFQNNVSPGEGGVDVGKKYKNSDRYLYRYLGGDTGTAVASAKPANGEPPADQLPDTSGVNPPELKKQEKEGTLGGSAAITANAAPTGSSSAAPTAPSASPAAPTSPSPVAQAGINMDGVTGALDVSNKTQQAQLSAAEESVILLRQTVDLLSKQGEIDPASTRIQNQKKTAQQAGNSTVADTKDKVASAVNTAQAPRGNGNGVPGLSYNIGRTG